MFNLLDISTLPIDAIEYNDELNNECFVNTKFLKSGGHEHSKKNKHRQNLLKDENQGKSFRFISCDFSSDTHVEL